MQIFSCFININTNWRITMLLRLDRITDAERKTIVPMIDQMIYTSDTKKLYIGDGETLGGLDLFDMIVDARIPKNTLTIKILEDSERLVTVLKSNELAFTMDTKKLYIGDDVNPGGSALTGYDLMTASVDTFNVERILSKRGVINIADLITMSENDIKIFNNQSGTGNFINVFNKVENPSFIRPNGIYSYRGSHENPETLQAGDELSGLYLLGWDGTDWINTLAIGAYAEKVEKNNINAKLSFYSVVNNDRTGSKGLHISKDGISIQKTVEEPIEAALDINGVMKLSALNAEPANSKDGMIAIADGESWDPANTGKQTLVVRLGGAWVQIAVAP
jgi:hypothetical protein